MPRTIGNVRDPKFLSEDFNLTKRTHVTERIDILLRGTVVDAFNRHVFNRSFDLNPAPLNANPQGNCRAANTNLFGCLDTSSTILGPRLVQLELRVEF
jgi:hypothetical protein